MANGFKTKRRNIVYERDNYTCVYCGVNLKEEYEKWKSGEIKRKYAKITLDHIIPKSVEKDLEKRWNVSNLATACSDCNNKKGSNILL